MVTYLERHSARCRCISPHQTSHKRGFPSPYVMALSMVVIAITLGHTSVASAALTRLTEQSQGRGNKGFSWTPIDIEGNAADFTMTARSSVDSRRPFQADAFGMSGTVYVEKDRKGTGVKNGSFGGSSGISGGGGDKDEELIFTYNSPVAMNSILLELKDIDFGHGLNDKDDPVLFLSQDGSGVFSTITETDIMSTSAFTRTGYKRGIIDFGSFSSILGFTDIDAFKLRETNDHIYAKSLSQAQVSPLPVPSPSALFLGSLGTVFASWIHRRRNL